MRRLATDDSLRLDEGSDSSESAEFLPERNLPHEEDPDSLRFDQVPGSSTKRVVCDHILWGS